LRIQVKNARKAFGENGKKIAMYLIIVIFVYITKYIAGKNFLNKSGSFVELICPQEYVFE
jgi:hypothetical protein